jgi:hypothetical protein
MPRSVLAQVFFFAIFSLLGASNSSWSQTLNLDNASGLQLCHFKWQLLILLFDANSPFV